jgi:hypothetical protein
VLCGGGVALVGGGDGVEDAEAEAELQVRIETSLIPSSWGSSCPAWYVDPECVCSLTCRSCCAFVADLHSYTSSAAYMLVPNVYRCEKVLAN